MEYIYAAMLLHKAGKDITEKNLSQVLTAAGINVDDVRVKALIASLTEVDIEQAIKSSPAMMAAPVAATTAAPQTAEAKPAEDKKKKEEDEKSKEDAALEGLGALFG